MYMIFCFHLCMSMSLSICIFMHDHLQIYVATYVTRSASEHKLQPDQRTRMRIYLASYIDKQAPLN